MGSGKTTLGQELSRVVRCRFFDMDHELENEHQLSIPEIFNRFGEPQFRIWENELLQRISVKENLVVATGGGLPCFHNNIDLLNQSGTTIYLKLSAAIIFDRLSKRRGTRPLIQGYSDAELMQYIQNTLTKREPLYLKARHIVEAELITVQDLVNIARNR